MLTFLGFTMVIIPVLQQSMKLTIHPQGRVKVRQTGLNRLKDYLWNG
jgi:hypothetical protein